MGQGTPGEVPDPLDAPDAPTPGLDLQRVSGAESQSVASVRLRLDGQPDPWNVPLRLPGYLATKTRIGGGRPGRIPMCFMDFREVRPVLCVRWNPAVLCLVGQRHFLVSA